jgi:alpha,alpha-trehalase
MRESGFDPSNVFGPFCCEIASYVPVCLNTLLYQLELDIAQVHNILEQPGADEWIKAAKNRVTLIDKYLWDPDSGLYTSYNVVTKRRRHYPFLTSFYPLWAGCASREQAQAVKGNLHMFETLGGLLTSTEVSGCQWDAPFGFAPLHYFAVLGLARYQFGADARRIAFKFVNTVAKGFEKHGVIFEKYNMRRGSAKTEEDLAFGYTSNEIGFGWTNGVFQEFLAKFQFV